MESYLSSPNTFFSCSQLVQNKTDESNPLSRHTFSEGAEWISRINKIRNSNDNRQMTNMFVVIINYYDSITPEVFLWMDETFFFFVSFIVEFFYKEAKMNYC